MVRDAWFAGDELTAADLQMSFPVESAIARAGDLADVGRLADFVKRIKERPLAELHHPRHYNIEWMSLLAEMEGTLQKIGRVF